MGEIINMVTGDGLDLAVHEWGAAGSPTVVLVHGYPDTATVWDQVARELVGSYHVVAHDVRGAGGSGVPATVEQYGLEHLVADLAAVIDATSPDARVHLVGHDWGSIQSWEAICEPRLSGRVASYTSISGPPLDHVARWMRRHRWTVAGLRQARRSWYVAAFSVPAVPELAWRKLIGRRFGPLVERTDGVTATDEWPAPTVTEDGVRGLNLYRANVRDRIRRPRDRHTDVPVQLVVPTRDRFVTPALLAGLERIAPDMRRREVDAGHWVIRSEPATIAAWIDEHARSTLS